MPAAANPTTTDEGFGRIDVHTHLLPGIDDGCQSYDQSLACARMLVDAGYTHAFCTPHVWPALPANNVEQIVHKVGQLQQHLDAAAVPLRVLPGGEINLIWGWPVLQGAGPGNVVSFAMEGRIALFDFWADTFDEAKANLAPAIEHLHALGLRLVLAHPERVLALQSDPRCVEWFLERDVRLQMNTWCLTAPTDSPTYRLAERLLKDDRYFVFGTDCHDAESMPTRIEGVRVAERLVGSEVVKRLTRVNPRTLVATL